MRIAWNTVIIVAGLVTANCTLAEKLSSAQCIGNICVKQPERTSSWLIKHYGKGKVQASSDDAGLRVHCFYDPNQQLWVEFEFSKSQHGMGREQLTGIFVTAIPVCPVSFVPRRPFPKLASERGVAIGDSELDIIEKMGPPSRRDDTRSLEMGSPQLVHDTRYASRFGELRLVYDEGPSSLLFNFYGIHNGRLLSIWLADSE